MKVTVLFFATLRQFAGTPRLEFDIVEGTSVADFKTKLGEHLPALVIALETSLVSINKEYAFPEEIIPEGAEIAIFPPVSGGSPPHLIQPEKQG